MAKKKPETQQPFRSLAEEATPPVSEPTNDPATPPAPQPRRTLLLLWLPRAQDYSTDHIDDCAAVMAGQGWRLAQMDPETRTLPAEPTAEQKAAGIGAGTRERAGYLLRFERF
jgi:hypothetical protein